MTEVAKLIAGRELDVLVAEKVMGWLNVFEDRDPDGEMHFWVGVTPDQHQLVHIPSYSTDIAAAWQVVEHLFDDGWALNISGEHGPDKPWDVRYWKQTQRGMAFADTAPLAICRAALAAVGQ